VQGAAAMGDAGRGRENGDTRGLQSWLPEQQISLSGLERDHPSKYSHNSQGHSVALHKKALPESADVTVELDLISMLTTYGYEHASTCVHARMDPRRHNPRILAILRFLAILMHTWLRAVEGACRFGTGHANMRPILHSCSSRAHSKSYRCNVDVAWHHIARLEPQDVTAL